MINDLTKISNKIWKTGEWPTLFTQSLIITLFKKGQPTTLPELPNH